MRGITALRALPAINAIVFRAELWSRTRYSYGGDIKGLHWTAALTLLRGRPAASADTMLRALALDSVHVDAPIEIYDWLSERRGIAAAQEYLHAFFAAREKFIFDQTATYVDYLRASRYVDYPLDIQVETLAKCNAACTFCQYPDLTRIGDKMSDEVIEKILIELETFPRDLPISLTLYGVNEPFLDRRIWDLMRSITDRLPSAVIALNTNGAPLNERNIDRLAEYRIARMSVSVNEYRKEPYEKLMAISFARTLKVLEILNRKVATGKLTFPVGMTRAGDGTIDDLRFVAWAQHNYPNLSKNYTQQFSWVTADGAPGLRSAPTGATCTHWFDMTIRADGRVSFCCLDGHIAWPKGNVQTEALMDIYNKPEVKMLRQSGVTRSHFGQCQMCHA
jgi:MoaA/NifB/PqqE/SkfB family radical SAM enzyme